MRIKKIMELATDIMAVIGFGLLGFMVPILIEIRSGQCTGNAYISLALLNSFGLIAASFVLG